MTHGHELRIEPWSRALVDGVPGLDETAPRERADLAVLTYCADERPLRGLAALIDWRLSGALSRLLRSGFCTGAAGETLLMPGRRGLPAARMILAGLGPSGELTAARARATAHALVGVIGRLCPRDVLLSLPGQAGDRELAEALLVGVVEGLGGSVPTRARPLGDDDGELGPAQRVAPMRLPGHTSGGLARAEGDVCRWWVVADPRTVGRLRRVLEGPLRAAASG